MVVSSPTLLCLLIGFLFINGFTINVTQAQGLNSAQCDCGYYDQNNQVIWTNEWHMDFEDQIDGDDLLKQLQRDFFIATYQIKPKYENSFSRSFSSKNVKVQNGLLQLSVTVNNSDPSAANGVLCGAIGTKRQDILYGSFRSTMRLTNKNGTVQAMYYYHADGEIDIEVLGAVTPPQAYFAIHPGLREPDGRASALTHDNHHLGFDPSADFHEYRFDWYPDRAEFYIDGTWAKTMTTNIAKIPGRFMFNHWTDGNPNFSKGPPSSDAVMEIKSITTLFNVSSSSNNSSNNMPCRVSQSPCSFQDLRNSQASPTRSSETSILLVAPSPTPISSSSDGSSLTLVASCSDESLSQLQTLVVSDSNKVGESCLVLFLFLIGCTAILL